MFIFFKKEHAQRKNPGRYQLLSCSEKLCSFMIAAWELENSTTFSSFHLSTSNRISIFCTHFQRCVLSSHGWRLMKFFCRVNWLWTWMINYKSYIPIQLPAKFCNLNREVVNGLWYFGHLCYIFLFIRTLLVPWLWKRQKMQLKLRSCDQLLSQSITKEERYFTTWLTSMLLAR